MSDLPMSEWTFIGLLEHADQIRREYEYGKIDDSEYDAQWEELSIEADRRDAMTAPDNLTAAWLHGANHARQRTMWPTGDEAARELAAARWFVSGASVPARDWENLPAWFQRERQKEEAAVLARLQPEGGEDEASK